MLLEIGDWKFDVDSLTTGEYSAAELAEHCTCGYCLNFYETVDRKYPGIRQFLKGFSVEIEAPDELMPYDMGAQLYCDANYSVSGRILQSGKEPILVDGLEVLPAEAGDIAMYCHSPEPYFVLCVGTFVLPWAMTDEVSDILS